MADAIIGGLILVFGDRRGRVATLEALQTIAATVDAAGAARGKAVLDRTEDRFGRVFDEATSEVDREALLESLGALCKQLAIDIQSRVRADGFDSNEPAR